jgi:leucyl aminopeptidase
MRTKGRRIATVSKLPSQVQPPRLSLSDASPLAVVGADVVAIPVLDDHDADRPGSGTRDRGPSLGPGAAELIDSLHLDLFALLDHANGRADDHSSDRSGSPARAGRVASHLRIETDTSPDLRLVLLVGVGRGTPGELRTAGAALARHTRGHATVATSLGALADDAGLRALVEGLVLGSFGFHRRSTGPVEQPVEQVVLAGLGDAAARKPALERGLAMARASWLSRTWALVPANEKNPQWMAERAAEVAAARGLKIKVWDETDLARDGFGGVLGVGAASASPPRLVRIDYVPRDAGRKVRHLVLVGKGITFDTGGLSIKPRESMSTMKRDMTGAGAVLAVMDGLAAVDCRVKVSALLPCAENSIGGNALRPGDVLRHYGGRTSEVTNTDAEGRLVLADALAYAVSEIKPDAIVDIATLTAASKISLGQRTGALFANDDVLAEQLLVSGRAGGEPVWRMPIVADYEERISSKIADADNSGGGPGAITATLFLQHFVGGLPWAHLDIASVAESPVDAFEYTQGPTGFGARLLLHWLELRDPLPGVS